MNKDYCEILLQAMNIIAENTASNSIINAEDSDSNELHLSLADPFDKMIQQDRIDLTKGIDFNNNTFIWNSFSTNKYDLLGIECTITTSLDTNAQFIGEYGIYFTVIGSNNTYKGSLSSTEMLGRVDKFSNMLQKKLFDLSDITNVISVHLEFYNNSNANVVFDNISLRIGYSTNFIGETSEPLILYGEDTSLEYVSNHLGQIVEGGTEILTVRWIYKEGDAYRVITHNNYIDMPKNASIRWYHYTPNSPQGDQYGGAYWALIPLEENENPFQRLVTNFDTSAEGEYYKVVILQENLDTNELTVAAETSKEDCFIKNTVLGVTEQLIDRKLELLDGTNGIYNYYAFDQLITANNQWRVAEERTAIISFNTSISEENFYKQLRKVEWKIPASQMFYCGEYENGEIKENDDGYFHLIYTNFSETNNYIEAIDKLMSIKYYIGEHRIPEAPNKIECIVSLSDGIDYKFEKEVSFSVLGSGGTDTSIIIRMMDEDGNVRSAIQPGEELYLHLQVFDSEGQDITTTIKQIIWTKLYEDSYIDLSNGTNNSYCKISTKNELFPSQIAGSDLNKWISAIKVSAVVNSYFDDNNTERLIEIQEIIDIPVAEVGKLGQRSYRGPKTIRYDSSNSNPSYDKSKIELVHSDETSLMWEIIPKDLSPSYPALRDNQIYPKNSLDINILNTPLALKAFVKKDKNTEEVVWIQPIIITQNKYFSSVINQWDESLQIKEDGNYILASSYVAGKKNTDNTFTGLIMGELGNISNEDNTQKQIGLFGYRNGTQSFVLDSNGNAKFSGKITAEQGSNIAGWETTKNVFGKLGTTRYSTELDGNIIKNYYFGIGLNSSNDNLGKSNFYPLAIGPLTALENGDWSKAFFKVDGTGKLFAANASIEGDIRATSGQIGEWIIDAGGTSPDSDGRLNKIIFKRTGEIGEKGAVTTGMAALTGNAHVTFWAGCPEGRTPWEYNAAHMNDGAAYQNVTPFYVTSEGYLKTSIGKIGEWNFGTIPYGCFNSDDFTGALYAHIGQEKPGSTTTFLRPSNQETDWAFGIIEKTEQGYKERFGIKHGGQLYSYGERSRGKTNGEEIKVPVSFTIEDGEITMIGTSTRFQFSGAEYKSYGLNNLELILTPSTPAPEGKDCYYYGYGPWWQHFGYYDGADYKPIGGIVWGTGNKYGQYTAVTLTGNWSIQETFINNSSRVVKNNIEPLPQKYLTLIDHLQPVRFKYNYGQSGRYHTGLILDELKDAMDMSNLDSSELAAYCITNDKTGEGGIRYEELIAILVMAIQQQNKQLKELEQKIKTISID